MKPTPRSVRPIPAALAAAALLTVLALLTAAHPARAADSVPFVANADGPAVEQTLELEEVWRRGTEDDDLFFGVVPAAVARDDRIYVLDSQVSTVYALDADGELLGELGREGEGPGEFRRAGTLIDMGDGTLGVTQVFPGRIVKLHADGSPAGVVLPGDPVTGGRDMVSGGLVTDTGLLLCGAHMTRQENARLRRFFLSRYADDGTVAVEYVGADDHFDFSAQSFRETDQDFINNGRWTALKDGRVIAGLPRDEYRLTLHAPDGAPLLEFGRPAEPSRRTPQQLARREASWKAGRRYQRFGVEQIFAATDPMIRFMTARDDEIWVLPGEGVRDRPVGVLQTWDVFTPDGVWARRVHLKAPGDGARDRLIFLDEDRALLVIGFQDAFDAMRGADLDQAELDDAPPVQIVLYTIPQVR